MANKRPEPVRSTAIHPFRQESDQITVHDSSLLPMKVHPEAAEFLDKKIVSEKFYNRFNFSKLAVAYGNQQMAIGITSANRQEGKTLVAANMAVSLAMAYKKSTVIVDLNFKRPKLHSIFGVDIVPGVAEAIEHQTLNVTPTRINNLFLLPAGDSTIYPAGIEHTLALRQILKTLKGEFDFVVVDLPSVLPFHECPVHFLNEMDGLINVIDTRQSKQDQQKKMFKHVDERRFIGYVLNKVDSKEA